MGLLPTDPVDVVARTAWAEAREDGEPGMHGVCSNIGNRAALAKTHGGKFWGWTTDFVQLCKMPWAYSSWNGRFNGHPDHNFHAMMAVTESDPLFRVALQLAARLIADHLTDNTGASNHYKVTTLPWPRDWGPNVAPMNVPTAVIGKQSFFDLVNTKRRI